MLSISTIKKALIPKKIKTPEEFRDVLSSKHQSVKIFGIKFSPKYELDQDIFDSATKGKSQLKVPEYLNLMLIGHSNPRLKIDLAQNASFKNSPPQPQDIYEGILGGTLKT